MKTVTIQIGNSDDKLTQAEWASFIRTMRQEVSNYCGDIHFFGAASSWEQWQNACWVVVCEDNRIDELRGAVKRVRTLFRQESAAWTEGETKFI